VKKLPIILISIGVVLPFLLGGAFYVGAMLIVKNQSVTPIRFETLAETQEVYTGEYISSGYLEQDFFDTAYSKVGSVVKVNPRSAIVTNDFVATDKIAEVFETIGSDRVETVVLISANNFAVGVSPAQTSAVGFKTPYGNIDPAQAAITKLVNSVSLLKDERDALRTNNGILNTTPFIKKSFPNAKIVPLIVDERLTKAEADELGLAIAEQLPNAVVIASLDMSRDQPSATTDYHNEITARYLEAGGCAEVSCEIDLEIDSNATLNTLLSFNRAKGLGVWYETYHGSLLHIEVSTNSHENSSYILGYFEDGPVTGNTFISLHFVGDIMLDRGVRVAMDKAGTVAYPWQKMSRFLMGSHLVVGNLEGTVNEQLSSYTYNPPFRFVFSPESVFEMGKYVDVVSLANNHASDVGSAGQLETKDRLDGMGIDWFGSYASPAPAFTTKIYDHAVAIIGYHQFQPEEAELIAEIQTQKTAGRFVILVPHWGPEYQTEPSVSEKVLAQKMVDAGADLIVGGHPHVPQGVSAITSVPVIYSLGNFVFDQRIPETYEALTTGVIIDDENITIYLLPVYTKGGQPTPMGDAESNQLLQKIAGASPEYLRDQILNQKIVIKRYE